MDNYPIISLMSWKRNNVPDIAFRLIPAAPFFFISSNELNINWWFSLTFVRHTPTGEPKKNKKGERSINNPYHADLWLTNELPSHPSELSVPYIIGDILGSPDRCGYARVLQPFPHHPPLFIRQVPSSRRFEKFVNFFLRRVTCPRTRV